MYSALEYALTSTVDLFVVKQKQKQKIIHLRIIAWYIFHIWETLMTIGTIVGKEFLSCHWVAEHSSWLL